MHSLPPTLLQTELLTGMQGPDKSPLRDEQLERAFLVKDLSPPTWTFPRAGWSRPSMSWGRAARGRTKAGGGPDPRWMGPALSSGWEGQLSLKSLSHWPRP